MEEAVRIRKAGKFQGVDNISAELLKNGCEATTTVLTVVCQKCAGLVIERLRVRIPAGAAGEISSPESTLCADSYSVDIPPPYYRSDTLKTPVIILPKVQVAGYT